MLKISSEAEAEMEEKGEEIEKEKKKKKRKVRNVCHINGGVWQRICVGRTHEKPTSSKESISDDESMITTL